MNNINTLDIMDVLAQANPVTDQMAEIITMNIQEFYDKNLTSILKTHGTNLHPSWNPVETALTAYRKEILKELSVVSTDQTALSIIMGFLD